MKRLARNLAVTAIAAAALAPAGAHAQWYSSYPRQAQGNPYGAQQPYAVQVAPGTYVIHRPDAERRRPTRRAHAAPENARARVHNDPALIEQLRKRSRATHKAAQKAEANAETNAKHKVERTDKHKVKVVREKPVVVVHKRVVDDPPRVIVRPHVIDDLPRGRGLFQPPAQQIVQDLPPYVERSPGAVPLPSSWHREYRPVERHRVHHKVHKAWHAERKTIRHVEHKAPRHVESRKVVVRSDLGAQRTIHAEAEVTIVGPDRMTIRLYRKGSAAKAEARKNKK